MYFIYRQNLRDSFSPISSIAGSFSPLDRSRVIQIFDQLQWTPEQVQALENNLYSIDTLQDNVCFHPTTNTVSNTTRNCVCDAQSGLKLAN